MSDSDRDDAPRWRPAQGAPSNAEADESPPASNEGARRASASATAGGVRLGSLLKTQAGEAGAPDAPQPSPTPPASDPAPEVVVAGAADDGPSEPAGPAEAPPLWSPAPSGVTEPQVFSDAVSLHEAAPSNSALDQPPADVAESSPTLWSPVSPLGRTEAVPTPPQPGLAAAASRAPAAPASSDAPREPLRAPEASVGMVRESRTHASEHDEFAPREPVRATPLAGVDPRSAPRSGDRRGLMIGGAVAALALAGIAGVLLLRQDGDEARDAPRAEARGEQGQAAAAGAFQPPDREAVRDAYAEVGRIYRTAGVSGLAEAGRSCFAGLNERPTYRGLDYCTALDAFGAAFAHRAAGTPAPADSWFGQVEGRFLSTAAEVMGPERDAAARLVDIRRLAIEVARESGPAFAAASPRPDPQTAPVEAVGSVQVQTVEPTPAPPPGAAPAAAPTRSANAAPPTRTAQAPAPAAVRRPAPAEVDSEAYAAARDPGPTASEVAAARPRAGRGPSFNCRYARSASERMVCSEPDLAALDRRLNAAYEDAIAAGASRRALRLEQDAWLARREAAAPDPDAVEDAYRRRIEELEAGG